MDLNIYDPDINLVGVIDQYSSLRWRRRFFEPGEFELHCKASAENCAMLQEENIIHRQDRKEAGIIEGIAIQDAQNGSGDEIVATGRMGSSMLERRIIMPTVNFSGPVEDAMRKLVSDNAIANRPLPNLVLGPAAGLTPTAAFQVTWKTVLTAIEALGRAAPLGFRVRLDVPNKQWVFEVYDGQDKTVTQHNRAYVLFSDEFGNITSPAYTKNTTGYCNYAIVGGQGEDADRVVITVDQTGGEPRRELWVDAKDLAPTGTKEDDFTGDGSTVAFVLSRTPDKISAVTVAGADMSSSDYALADGTVTFTAAPASGAAIAISYDYAMTAEEYAAVLAQRGMEKLAEAVKVENFNANAADTQNFQYLTDWDLGDIVSMEKWGILLNQRITEVEEVDEGGVFTVTPVCGSPLPEALNLGDDS